jgi:hypothetical protein
MHFLRPLADPQRVARVECWMWASEKGVTSLNGPRRAFGTLWEPVRRQSLQCDVLLALTILSRHRCCIRRPSPRSVGIPPRTPLRRDLCHHRLLQRVASCCDSTCEARPAVRRGVDAILHALRVRKRAKGTMYAR